VPLEQVFRDEWGRILASLIGFLGDFDIAEDAAQEAFEIAAERWPRGGTPANPRAWLLTGPPSSFELTALPEAPLGAKRPADPIDGAGARPSSLPAAWPRMDRQRRLRAPPPPARVVLRRAP
jgi:hypothetical protein